MMELYSDSFRVILSSILDENVGYEVFDLCDRLRCRPEVLKDEAMGFIR